MVKTNQTVEVEAKLAVSVGTEIPDLVLIDEVHCTAEPSTRELLAIYFDTPDLRLTRERITLRHRTDGWHLKLPDNGSGRTEITVDHSDDTPPEPQTPQEAHIPSSLLRQVRPIVRGHKLRPIARVHNTRQVIMLKDAAGDDLMEFCDDHVHATSLIAEDPQQANIQWREWEVELAQDLAGSDHGEAILASAVAVLIDAGAREATSPSKLLTTLGDSIELAPAPPCPEAALDIAGPKDVYSGIVEQLYVARNRIIEWDPAISQSCSGAPHHLLDAVHDTRNTLALISEVLDPDHIEHPEKHGALIRKLKSELKLLSQVIGRARDAETVYERIVELLDTEPVELVDQHTAERLRQDAKARLDRELQRVAVGLGSQRYLNMLEDLDRFLAEPPLPSRSDRRKATAILVRAVKRSFLEFQKQHRAGVGVLTDDDASGRGAEEHLRSMRRVVDRLRTASCTARELTPYRLKKVAKHTIHMQKLLQEALDTLAARRLIFNKARHVRGRGDDTFGYGIVYQQEAQSEAEIVEEITAEYSEIKSAFKKFRRSVEST